MLVLRRFNFEIKPTFEQKEYLDQTFDDCRFAWNQTLNLLQKRFGKRPNITYKKLLAPQQIAKEAVPLKKTYEFLTRSSSKAIQMKLLDLGKAYQSYFRKSSLLKKETKLKYTPKFKSYKDEQSFGLTRESFKILENEDYTKCEFYIAKCKTPIKVFWSRELPSPPSSLSISKTVTGRYFVSFVCEFEKVRESGEEFVGIDVGIKTYAAVSNKDSVPIENPNFLSRKLKHLANIQAKYAKTVKGSKRREKLRFRIAKIHEKISNQRKDFQHKLTDKLVKANRVIVVETLKVKKMLKKDKKTNSKLSRSISDVVWGMFFQKLAYKVSETENGKMIHADSSFPSTQLCSSCNTRPEKDLTLADRVHKCECGKVMDRDLNAALNLKKIGQLTFKYFPKLDDPSIKIILASDFGHYKTFPEYQ